MDNINLICEDKIFSFNPKSKLLGLSMDGELFWLQSLDHLLFASIGRPWQSELRMTLTEVQTADSSYIRFLFDEERIHASLTFSFTPSGDLNAALSVENISGKQLDYFTCGLMLDVLSHTPQKVTIPHVIYNDNPSADPQTVVPHIGKEPGKGVAVEESRLPIPGVNLEWNNVGTQYLTLLSVPQIVTGEDKDYWSLGALYGTEGHTIVALSGPLMFNGIKDLVYGGQCTPLPYERGYRFLVPEEKLEKQFIISFGFTEEGRGFRSLVDLGYRYLKPFNQPAHTFPQMVEYKKLVLDSRYVDHGDSNGYLCFGTANTFGNLSKRPEYHLYAWTGQALKLAWGECKLGLDYGDTERLERAMKSVDFFVNGTEGLIPGLLRCYYMIEEKSWRGGWDEAHAPLSSRMEGEALIDLIDILFLLREHGKETPAHWEELVKRSCAFLSDPVHWTEDGFLPGAWTITGESASPLINTAGVPCIDALVKAYRYFGSESYLETAKLLFSRYYDFHMKTFDKPFARSTMDAKCEDKEAGIYMFCSAVELYKVTGDSFYRNAADVAADWLLTFVYFWETGFRPGTLCHEKQFVTTGWPGVSVQNHHLDVFFPSWEMYEYGKLTGNEKLMHMGRTVAQALTYGVCTKPGEWGYSVVGEQGEQYYQTNYFQIRYPTILQHTQQWRGGMQCWNPSWITAQVLQASLRFMEE